MASGWTGINEGVDVGDDVETKLTDAFNNIDADTLANKELSELNQASLAALESPTHTTYVPQTEPVPYTEGKLFYSNDTGTHDLQGRYEDVTLQIGREQQVEVLNNSLVDIPNGASIRYSGIASGTPVVVPAIANSFDTSGGFGVATHTIPAGQKGVVTTFGAVSGLDLSAFSDGDILYLSETVAGGYTTIPPDIVTRIGIVFDNDAVNGIIFANPDSNAQLPSIYGNLSNGSLPATLSANTPETLQNFSVVDDKSMPTDGALGEITVPITGKYRATINLGLSYSTVGNQEIVVQLLLKSIDATETIVIPVTISRNSSISAWFPSPLVDLTAGKTYHLQVQTDATVTSVAVTLSELDLTSVRF